MPNPIQAAWDYLRGADVKAVAAPAGHATAVPTLSQAEQSYGWLSQPGMQGVFSNMSDSSGADGNSAVFACLLALANAHIEPPLKVMRKTDPEADPDWLVASPLQALLDDPNPWHDALELWFWTQYARHCDGNAYWRKVRTGNEITGNVTELWPISPRLIRPVTEDGSRNFIDYYEYTWAAGKKEKVPTENIVHFRLGIDDRDQRLGLAPIARLIREIASDDEATLFQDALLHNYGIPGLVVQVPSETPIPEDAAIALKERMSNAFGNGNRGNVGILTGGADMKQLGFSPEQLNLEVLHNVPETRIASVMGLPPAMAGLGVGLAQTSNFASMRQVRENFTEMKQIPTWRMDAAKLNKQLKPDFTPERTIFIEHDLSKVRALQEDMDAQYRRLDLGVRSYWIRPSEARVAVGLVADPELDDLWLERATSAPSAALGEPAGPKDLDIDDLETKAQDLDTRRYAELVQTMVDAAAPRLAADLDAHFDGQRRRAKRALLSGG